MIHVHACRPITCILIAVHLQCNCESFCDPGGCGILPIDTNEFMRVMPLIYICTCRLTSSSTELTCGL